MFIHILNEYREKNNLYEFAAWFMKQGFPFPITWNISIDARNPSVYISNLNENGTTIDSIDFYYKKEKKYKHKRKLFLTFLENVFKEIFGPNHPYEPKKVYEIEKKIAKFMLSEEDLIYITKTYHNFNQSSCLQECHFDIHKFSKYFGFKTTPKHVLVENPNFIKNVMKMLNENWSSDSWKTYWVYQIIIIASKFHKKLHMLFNNFFNNVLLELDDDDDDDVESTSKINMKLRAIKHVELYMNTTISKKYLEFFSNHKVYLFCENLVKRYQNAFRERLQKNNWLHKETIQKILKKIHNMTIVIGHKKKWESDPETNEVPFSPVDAWENYQMFHQWSIKRDIENTDKKVLAKDVWLRIEDQNVYDVNAYYNVIENELVLPNAILQVPFVDLKKNMAYNIARIGTTIGHEIIHGYDDDGFNYDEHGCYVETGWWKETDIRIYKEKQQQILKQYQTAAKRDNISLKGKINLGENIADIGGFLLSEDVLVQYLNEQNICGDAQKKYLIDFYTHYAKQWRSTQNVKTYDKYVNLDVHSFNKYRVNCVLAQSEKFRNIFNVNQDDNMFYNGETIW